MDNVTGLEGECRALAISPSDLRRLRASHRTRTPPPPPLTQPQAGSFPRVPVCVLPGRGRNKRLGKRTTLRTACHLDATRYLVALHRCKRGCLAVGRVAAPGQCLVVAAGQPSFRGATVRPAVAGGWGVGGVVAGPGGRLAGLRCGCLVGGGG